jgi:hypothetical protein
MPGDAGAAIRGLVLRVAGVEITNLTAAVEFSSIFRSIQEVEILRRWDVWGQRDE